MANIQIIQGDFEKKLKLQFAPGIRAGFPSPAEDYNHDTLDFNRDLIRNPEATFYGKVEGDSMIERYAACLEAIGVKTAYDFAEHNQSWVHATFNNIVIKRTWRELNGEDCVPNEDMAKKDEHRRVS